MPYLHGRAEKPGRGPTVPRKCRLVACLLCRVCWRLQRKERRKKDRLKREKEGEKTEGGQGKGELHRADVATMVTSITRVHTQIQQSQIHLCLTDTALYFGREVWLEYEILFSLC